MPSATVDATRDAIAIARYLAPGLGLFLSGGMLSLSYFSSPIARGAITSPTSSASPTAGTTSSSAFLPSSPPSERASFALAQIKGLFSSGSYIFPPAIATSSGLMGVLAYALPSQRWGWGTAAVLMGLTMPFTTQVMVPLCNGRIIELDAKVKKTGGEGVSEEEVRKLLASFEWTNGVRAALATAGSLVALWVAVF